ncbi:CbrC family protein [Tenacibaculum ovolyticum]|uniref:CbrC family protein n=1 Tax=Tenacibaculum ovolyticum TaxID=104270 RepID=UPI0007EC54F9|nr:CbrC family protein [Tenacibaculum ovolyticum]
MKPIHFKYFESPIEESIFDTNDEKHNCSFCEKSDFPIAELDDSITIIANENIDNVENVCLKCLQDKKYGFVQEIEHDALVTKEGMIIKADHSSHTKESTYYTSYILPIEKQLDAIDKSKSLELIHTPPFRAWQGAKWLVHCNDFMKYIGTWQHEDFLKNAPDSNAEDYYENICLYGGDDLYESQFGPNKSEYANCTFYAFECLTCKEKRGYIDNI